MRNREASQNIFITLFSGSCYALLFLYQPLSKGCRNGGPKPFCSAKRACFDFSSSNVNVQGHIQSTGGIKVGTPLKLGTH